MSEEIKKINQAGVSALLKERLEHPDLYVDKPLVIWNSDYLDGVMSGLVREALRELNQGKPREQWKGSWVNPRSAPKVDRLGLSIITHDADFTVSLKQYPVPTVMFAPFTAPQDEIIEKLPDAEQYIFHDPSAKKPQTSRLRFRFKKVN